MPRETVEKIERSPNMVHIEAQRNASGTVQMTSVGSVSAVAGTAGTTTTLTGATGLAGFTSAVVTASPDNTATTPVTGTVNRDGSSIGTFSFAATGQQTSTVTSLNTLTTPANAPNWTLSATANGSETTVNLTASQEQRWV